MLNVVTMYGTVRVSGITRGDRKASRSPEWPSAVRLPVSRFGGGGAGLAGAWNGPPALQCQRCCCKL